MTIRPLVVASVLALSAGLSLAACDRQAEHANNQINALAEDAGDALDSLANSAETLANEAAEDARAAVSDATPKGRDLARRAGEGLDRAADATGRAAEEAGAAIAEAGRDAKQDINRRTDGVPGNH